MSKRAPRKEDGLDLLMRLFDTGSSNNAILGQEADGQRSFVGSDTLPTEIQGNGQEVLEAAGVKFLGIVEDDPLFQWVELPPGWKKVATGHSMWSDLVDDKGRHRAGIFYKAAFYDRAAHVGVNCRFSVRSDYDKLKEGVAQSVVYDGSDELYRTRTIEYDVENERDLRFDLLNELDAEARAWLDDNYPDWQNAAAYWNDES